MFFENRHRNRPSKKWASKEFVTWKELQGTEAATEKRPCWSATKTLLTRRLFTSRTSSISSRCSCSKEDCPPTAVWFSSISQKLLRLGKRAPALYISEGKGASQTVGSPIVNRGSIESAFLRRAGRLLSNMQLGGGGRWFNERWQYGEEGLMPVGQRRQET